MARQDEEFCKMETSFILSDPRFVCLKHREKALYITLWAEAVRQRREVIRFYGGRNKFFDVHNFNSRNICTSLDVLSSNDHRLIEVIDDDHVRVCGVRNKHRHLRNWQEAESDPNGSEMGQGFAKNGSERESTMERESTPLPPAGEGQSSQVDETLRARARRIFDKFCLAVSDQPGKPRQFRFETYEKMLVARLESWSEPELELAVDKFSRSAWHRGWDERSKRSYVEPGQLFRNNQRVDMFLNKPESELLAREQVNEILGVKDDGKQT